jgi:hypothetical protein
VSVSVLIGNAASRSPFAGRFEHELTGFELVPGSTGPLFDDGCWDLSVLAGAPAQVKRSQVLFEFAAIANPAWQLVARELMIALLSPGQERVLALPRARRTPANVRTSKDRLYYLTFWLQWLTGQGVTSLRQVTQEHCDRYLQHRRALRPTTNTVMHEVLAIKDLARYRELFTADAYPPGFMPWPGRGAAALAGIRSGGENRTPPVPAAIFNPAVSAALYLIQHVGPSLLKLLGEVRAGEATPPRRCAPAREEFAALLGSYVEHNRPLPAADAGHVRVRLGWGWRPDDPLLRVNFADLARQLSVRQFTERGIQALRDIAEPAVAAVGIAPLWARDAPVIPAVDGGEPVPWTLPLLRTQIGPLTGLVVTACLLVAAALSGMRSSELMELTTASCTAPRQVGDGLFRFGLTSRRIKGEPWGGSPDEWIVIEPAWRAVELATQLAGIADGERIFGRFQFVSRMRVFRRWVNGPAGIRLGLQPIPDGRLTLTMLRRTLALELARRPHGLLAAKMHLKHISVATTEGYTRRPGGAQARFHAEISAAETAHKAELVARVYHDYQAGQLPAGPGARDPITDLHSIDNDQGSTPPPATVVATDRQIELLIKKRAATLHIQAANYCWFTDPGKALCLKLAGTPTATAPLAGLCDAARCPQATFHPQHRDVWASSAATTTTFLGNPRLPAGEAARLRAEHDRAQHVVAAIDAATEQRR